MATRDPLLQPFRLRHLALKNRILSTAHAPNYIEDAKPKQRYQLYHEEKAKGGLALTMFGGSSNVAPDSPSVFGQIDVGDDGVLPYLSELAERVHRHGAAVMCQITHMGRRTYGHVGDWLPVIGPSHTRERAHRAFPKEMERSDIDRVVAAYAAGAGRCKQGRPRRPGDPRRRPSGRPVPVARREQAPRPLRRQCREPPALRDRGARRGACAHRRRFHRRPQGAGGRVPGRRAFGRRLRRDRPAPGRQRPGRLPQRQRRPHLHRLRPRPEHPGDEPALGAVPRDRRADQAGGRPAGVPRRRHRRSGDGAPRGGGGAGRHGRYDPGPYRRSPSGTQAWSAARRSGSAPASASASASIGSARASRRSAPTTRRPAARPACRTE